ncbi:MAG: DNA-3-methyladenine glycosylase I [bacterium]|nr:DNA-3-methyladenine glycosylase I [bacterium]
MSRVHDDGVSRCAWCTDDDIYRRYHDEEWGVPVRDDQRLFGMLQLEGAQAGLSWITVLNKRARYEHVFHGFDIERCAAMTDRQLERLLEDPGIIRNRLKVYGVRKNAKAALRLMEREGSLSEYLWSFVGGAPIINRPATIARVPTSTAESDAMSNALKKAGFTFVGSTICYAFMQAVGMVNDHTAGCFRAAAK